MCADGWMTTYIEKDSLQIVNGRKYHRDRRRYELGYCNTNKKLLEEFSKDVFNVYKIKVRRRKSTDLVFKSKRVFSRIKELGGPDGYLYILTSNTDGMGFPGQNDDKLLRIVK